MQKLLSGEHKGGGKKGKAPAQVLHLGLNGAQALLLARVQVAQLPGLTLAQRSVALALLGRPARTPLPVSCLLQLAPCMRRRAHGADARGLHPTRQPLRYYQCGYVVIRG